MNFDDGSPYTYCVGKKDSAIKVDVLAAFSASMEKGEHHARFLLQLNEQLCVLPS